MRGRHKSFYLLITIIPINIALLILNVCEIIFHDRLPFFYLSLETWYLHVGIIVLQRFYVRFSILFCQSIIIVHLVLKFRIKQLLLDVVSLNSFVSFLVDEILLSILKMFCWTLLGVNGMHHHLTSNSKTRRTNMRGLCKYIKFSLHHIPEVLFVLEVLNFIQVLLKETMILTSYLLFFCQYL